MSRDRLMDEIEGLLREVIWPRLGPRPGVVDPHMAVGHIRCLRAIAEAGDPTMSRLSDTLELHPSTVTALVDALVERGLVERRADPEDRRVVRAVLTEHGRQQRSRIRKAMRERSRALLGELSDQDLQEILRALQLLGGAIARHSGEGAPGGPEVAAAVKDDAG